MRDTLLEFRGWLDKLFREGRINNISETQHWIDVFNRQQKELTNSPNKFEGDVKLLTQQVQTGSDTQSKGCGKEIDEETICGGYIKWGNKVHLCEECKQKGEKS